MQETAQGTQTADLEPKLEALLSRHSERLPFLHPAWLRTWLSEFGGAYEPLFLTCSNGGLLGIAPLMRGETGLSFIGDASICDFMDVLVDPEKEDEAYSDLWRQVCAEDWSELDLWGLMASSPTRERVKRFA
ncbi:MAG TPA: hypothetical protein VFY54_14945, partial [Rubrobacter sp.]|nr:hypothetical protein [Rubrobacter sp.]